MRIPQPAGRQRAQEKAPQTTCSLSKILFTQTVNPDQKWVKSRLNPDQLRSHEQFKSDQDGERHGEMPHKHATNVPAQLYQMCHAGSIRPAQHSVRIPFRSQHTTQNTHPHQLHQTVTQSSSANYICCTHTHKLAQCTYTCCNCRVLFSESNTVLRSWDL